MQPFQHDKGPNPPNPREKPAEAPQRGKGGGGSSPTASGGSRRKGGLLTQLVHLGLEGAENLLHSADLVGLRFKVWRSVRAHAALGCPAAARLVKQPAATIETSRAPVSREHGAGQNLDPNEVVAPVCGPARLPRTTLSWAIGMRAHHGCEDLDARIF